jgi:hypothetical protein
MAEQFRAKGQDRSAERFVVQARDAKERSAVIRQVLMKDDPPAELPEPDFGQGQGKSGRNGPG